jgi:hypothetical protein
VPSLQNILELKDGAGYTLALGSGVNKITITADSTGSLGPNTLLVAFDPSQVTAGASVQLSNDMEKGQSVSFTITVP